MSKDIPQRLLEILERLPLGAAQNLLKYAESLLAREAVAQSPPPAPATERSVDETVVMAIKRLTGTYPMLDRAKLLNEASALMTQHVLQGRAAAEVIDELEAIFRRHDKARQRETTGP